MSLLKEEEQGVAVSTESLKDNPIGLQPRSQSARKMICYKRVAPCTAPLLHVLLVGTQVHLLVTTIPLYAPPGLGIGCGLGSTTGIGVSQCHPPPAFLWGVGEHGRSGDGRPPCSEGENVRCQGPGTPGRSCAPPLLLHRLDLCTLMPCF